MQILLQGAPLQGGTPLSMSYGQPCSCAIASLSSTHVLSAHSWLAGWSRAACCGGTAPPCCLAARCQLALKCQLMKQRQLALQGAEPNAATCSRLKSTPCCGTTTMSGPSHLPVTMR